MTRIVLFRDFVEDRRVSMEVYANRLAAALAREAPDGWRIEQCQPGLPRALSALPLGERQRMRLARYLAYPFEARLRQGDINHVIDHGYGHLRYVLRPERTVVTVHDLIPLLRWKGAIRGVAAGRRPWLGEISLRALKRAARLIAVSANTKRDLVRHVGCEPERISVVYSGLDPAFRPHARDERLRSRAALGLPGSAAHLVLITGEAFYKNQETSLAVVRQLQPMCRQPVLLVRLGRPTREWDAAVRASGMAERVVALAPVPDARMPELYNAVDCVLFPSWYEGFGLPPLEAMACGTPAVTSNAAALPEAAGDAAPMAAPDDVGGLAEAVCAMLEDTERRRVQIEKGLAHAAGFTWERTARETLQVYKAVLAEADR